MKKNKFKIGDKVIIKSSQCGHLFDLGEEVELIKVCLKGTIYEHFEALGKSGKWFISESDFKRVGRQNKL